MNTLRTVTPRDVCLPEAPEASSPATTAYTVKGGDTLSKLADRLQQQGLAGTRQELLRQILMLNPQLTDPDRIQKGTTLLLPTAPASPARRQDALPTNSTEPYVCRAPVPPARLAASEAGYCGPAFTAGALATLGPLASQAATFQRTNGVAFPTSVDGTPFYKQGDTEAGGNWGARRLGNTADTARTIASRGCAMTSVAMALSKLSGETITPAVLDQHLDTHAGYVGNALKWDVAAQATPQPFSAVKTTKWSLDTVNAELAAGRPVVLGVDYKAGKSGGTLGTDHWVCLTRRDPQNPDRYFANDPAHGREISFLRQPDGTLREETLNAGRTQKCRTSGEFVTFHASR